MRRGADRRAAHLKKLNAWLQYPPLLRLDRVEVVVAQVVAIVPAIGAEKQEGFHIVAMVPDDRELIRHGKETST